MCGAARLGMVNDSMSRKTREPRHVETTPTTDADQAFDAELRGDLEDDLEADVLDSATEEEVLEAAASLGFLRETPEQLEQPDSADSADSDDSADPRLRETEHVPTHVLRDALASESGSMRGTLFWLPWPVEQGSRIRATREQIAAELQRRTDAV